MPAHEQRRCLLIEDDHAIADMYAFLLQRAGWEVEIAGDGLTGLERARAWSPHVVLLDMMLPGLEGFGVLEQLREDPHQPTPVVLILSNSHGTPGRLDRARELGVADWLVKSNTTPSDLVARLESLPL